MKQLQPHQALKMESRTQLAVVLTLTVAADLIIRFGTPFDFARVMHAEAILFTVTTGVLLFLHRRKAVIEGRQDRWRAILVGFLALGAMRCILWTIGVPLVGANFGTLGALGVVVLVGGLTRGRRKAA
jgi:hypothetical protein